MMMTCALYKPTEFINQRENSSLRDVKQILDQKLCFFYVFVNLIFFLHTRILTYMYNNWNTGYRFFYEKKLSLNSKKLERRKANPEN